MFDLTEIEVMIANIKNSDKKFWMKFPSGSQVLDGLPDSEFIDKSEKKKKNRLRDFLLRKLIESGEDFTVKQINKAISSGKVIVNNMVSRSHVLPLKQNDKINYGNFNFVFEEETENVEITISEPVQKVSQSITETIILTTLKNEFNLNRINKGNSPISDIFSDPVSSKESEAIIATLVYMFEALGDSNLSNLTLNQYFKLIDKYQGSLYKKLSISEKDYPSQKLHALTTQKKEILFNIKKGIEQLETLHDLKSFSHDFRKSIFKTESKYLIKPFIDPELQQGGKIDILFDPILGLLNAVSDSDKYQIYQNYKNELEELTKTIKNSKYLSSNELFLPLITRINETIKAFVFKQGKIGANIHVNKVDKKYPFLPNNAINLLIKIINNGDSYADRIYCQFLSEDFSIGKNIYEVENFAPGEFVIDIPVTVKPDLKTDNPLLKIDLEWKNFDGTIQSENYDFRFESQDNTVPWENLRKKAPYSLKAVEDQTKLLGRDEILTEISSNIQDDSSINSYILYGQKRVGKTSIVKTIRNLFNSDLDNQTIISFVDVTSVRLKNVDATISELVKRTCQDIKKIALNKYKNNSSLTESINSITIPQNSPSLIGLRDYIDEIQSLISQIRIIIVIDEFDEMGIDLYQPGDTSDTFFRNLRGINNEYDNVAFILVGAENMPKIYNWHGDLLNNWKNRAIDTFSVEQFDLYRKVIEIPVEPYVKYTDNAIKEIYELSGGNPYFTKMVCGWIFEFCLSKKDAEVTISDVNYAAKCKLRDEAKTSFQHFWKDGILDTFKKKEHISDLRKRTLIAFAKACNIKSDFEIDTSTVTLKEIERHFSLGEEALSSKDELMNQINEFKNRKIIAQDVEGYRLKPKLFLKWLIDYGLNEIIEGSVNKELLEIQKKEEEKLKITEKEIRDAIHNSKYQTKTITSQKISKWLDQFHGNHFKRIFFNIYKKSIYLNDKELLDFYRNSKSEIFKNTVVNLKTKSKFKRDDTLIIVPEPYYDENILFAKFFAENAYIKLTDIKKSTRKIDLKPEKKILITIYPLVINYKEIIREYEKFTQLNSITSESKKSFFIIPILAISTQFEKLKLFFDEKSDVSLIQPLQLVNENQIIVFSEESVFFNNKGEMGAAKEFIKESTGFVFKNTYLGIIFEKICPQRTLPIFWSDLNGWHPLFINDFDIQQIEDDYGASDIEESEERRHVCAKIGSLLERKMLQVVKETLIKKFGDEEKKWWVQGVPSSIREKCATMWEKEHRKENEESYMYFIDFSSIAKKNPELKEIFYDQMNGSEAPTVWLEKLNDIRNRYSHPNKSAPTKSDYEYLKEQSNRFFDRLEKSGLEF